MIRTVGFAYAGARIQSRHGRLVPQATWDRLHRLGTPGAFLQAARDTPLRPWLSQIDAQADARQTEAQLRALFRRRVIELAAWSPPPWRAAVAWTAILPDLPAIAARPRDADAAPLPEELRPLRQALDERRPLDLAWLEHWRALWPAARPAERRALEELVRMLQHAVAGAARDAPAALAALHRPLRRLFRRQTRAPAGLFAYLALAWIEFAALRGALLRRWLALPLEGTPS